MDLKNRILDWRTIGECRMDVRVPVHRACRLTSGWGRSMAAKLKDISFSGAYVAARAVPPEGRTVTLTIPGQSRVVRATVVRREQWGAALAFLEYDNATESHLTDLIASQLSGG